MRRPFAAGRVRLGDMETPLRCRMGGAIVSGEVFGIIGWIVFAGLLAAHVYAGYRIVKDGDGELLARGRLERRKRNRRVP
jgi:hypothetical protein